MIAINAAPIPPAIPPMSAAESPWDDDPAGVDYSFSLSIRKWKTLISLETADDAVGSTMTM